MNKLAILIVLCLGIGNLKAQTNALSNSPYSLFGVGIPNTFSTGKTNALGGAGIALKSDNSLNSLNPASLGAMPVKHFYFDIGYKAQPEGITFSPDGRLFIANEAHGGTATILEVVLP